ncbi:hypothetical protein ZIOFF_062664 [Zingiber officinale]|uniref:AMP-activated protein kinase glycogen-binding domain-containing protein n=1 Tax=Zingiber officinale TaxID=94328 RepID=A0A8J5KJF5_ZINOF|nr:hypothetical protein ZIOFF_062664 [Zingiber officinale]
MDTLRWSAPPLPALGGRSRTPQISNLGAMRAHHLRGNIAVNVSLKSSSNTDNVDAEVKDQKSETYSNDMTKAMGAVLTYRHELGMNYNFIYPGLIVGSCLQTPLDVDKLRKIGVRTIFCLQQDPDLEYFGVDIGAIREYAIACGDIEHIRAEIRDFDAFDLRMRLPAVVSKLYKAIKRNRGVTYVHCTAGLGRAPGVAVVNNSVDFSFLSFILIFSFYKDMLVHVLLAYMFWIEGYKLNEGHQLLQLTGLSKSPVTLMWKDGGCSSVEISGLDIGWGQEGRYEYKYIVDGEWMCNEHELLTFPNSDGQVNNYVEIFNRNMSTEALNLTTHLRSKDADLTKDERQMIRELFEHYNN